MALYYPHMSYSGCSWCLNKGPHFLRWLLQTCRIIKKSIFFFFLLRRGNILHPHGLKVDSSVYSILCTCVLWIVGISHIAAGWFGLGEQHISHAYQNKLLLFRHNICVFLPQTIYYHLLCFFLHVFKVLVEEMNASKCIKMLFISISRGLGFVTFILLNVSNSTRWCKSTILHCVTENFMYIFSSILASWN